MHLYVKLSMGIIHTEKGMLEPIISEYIFLRSYGQPRPPNLLVAGIFS